MRWEEKGDMGPGAKRKISKPESQGTSDVVQNPETDWDQNACCQGPHYLSSQKMEFQHIEIGLYDKSRQAISFLGR